MCPAFMSETQKHFEQKSKLSNLLGSFGKKGATLAPVLLIPIARKRRLVRVRPETSGRIAEFSEHEAD